MIPTTILDGFFEDPDYVRKFALQQQFYTDPNNMWPGKRSAPLHEINPHLFFHTVDKFLSLFYTRDAIEEYEATAMFQIVDGRYDQGWVHRDSDLITGIVYLNPNPPLKTGTMIYDPKVPGAQIVNGIEKVTANRDPETHRESVKEFRDQNNGQFETSIGVANKYNRLIAFDSNLHHAAMDFFGEEARDETSRLTLIFYITKLVVDKTPVHRLRSV